MKKKKSNYTRSVILEQLKSSRRRKCSKVGSNVNRAASVMPTHKDKSRDCNKVHRCNAVTPASVMAKQLYRAKRTGKKNKNETKNKNKNNAPSCYTT